VMGFFIPGMGYFVALGTLDYLFYLFVCPLICYGLFFILTVELPDVECDTTAQKRNIFVKWGTRAGKRIFVLANILGTTSLATILFTGVVAKKFDPTLIAVFSFLPLIASIMGVGANPNDIHTINQQVTVNVNIGSLILFLFLTDVSLLSHL
jgi:1,4-dihydroxy-2-naphthoate octaprenyltransferase